MKNVLLVFGGKSYEHDISCITAAQIFNRFKSDELKLIPFYVSRKNLFYIYNSDKFELSDFAFNKPLSAKKFKEVAFVSGEPKTVFVKSRIGLKQYLQADVALFATHGADGENGKLQALFDSQNIACSVGDELALSVCMNKFIFKQVMKGLKIRQLSGFKLTESEFESHREACLEKVKKLKFPLIIKAVSGGSSIGVFVANDLAEFEENLKSAFEFDSEVLLERFLPNAREFNVAVLGTSDKFRVSEVDEPLKVHELLSFEDKYVGGAKAKGEKRAKSDKMGGIGMAGERRNFPANISAELREKIRTAAEKIFVGLGLFGVVRIDFLFDEAEDKLFVCELNAIPGSLAYYFFEENKVSSNSLVFELTEIAEKMHILRHNFNEDFCTKLLN